MARGTLISSLVMLLVVGGSLARAQNSLDDFIRAIPRSAGGTAFSPDDLADWNAYNRAGWRAINKGYYDTAEHEFLAAIKMAKKAEDPRLLARSYADFAWALRKQGRLNEAEPLIKWAAETRQARLEPGSAAISQSLNQLATLYVEQGRYPEAEPVLRKAISLQDQSAKPNPLERARSSTLLAVLLVSQRRYAEAEALFVKALRAREQGQGAFHPDTAEAANNLAWVDLEQGKLDDAKPLFERAQRIFESSRGPSHPSVARVLDGLGMIDVHDQELSEAEAKFRRALAIWDEVSLGNDREVAETIDHLVGVLEKLNRTDEARPLRDRSAKLKGKPAPRASDHRLTLPGPVLDTPRTVAPARGRG
jgi:tetratricopeptide (TPR) repeat protein